MMKKIIPIGLSLTAFVPLSLSFTQDRSTAAFSERQYLDPKCNCYVRESYADGKRINYEQLADSNSYTSNGLYVRFYDNGDTANISHFKEGQSEGAYTAFYKGGKVSCTGSYTLNEHSGTWTTYNEQGRVIEVTTYEPIPEGSEGQEHYTQQHYDQTGDTLIYTVTFKGYNLIQSTINNQAAYDYMIWVKENRTGKEIFLADCGSCHHPYQDATGPKLKGVMERHPEKWIRSWIANPPGMIAKGDKAAIAIYNKWNRTAMTCFPNLSAKEMNSLLAYLKSL